MSAHNPRSLRKSTQPAQPAVIELLEGRLLLSLLGVGDDIGLPYVPYDGGTASVMSYKADTGALNGDALPVSLRYINAAGTATTARISGVVDNTRDFTLRIYLNTQGQVTGGITGDDLVIKGVVSADLNRDGTNESYSGTLLTGEIVAFGYLDPGTQDQYDFLFIPTGGTLMSYFQDKYIGLTMNSFSNSTFNGLFTENFGGGQVQGNIGPVDKPTIAGKVFFDANNNGLNDGEAGIPGVGITLTGTDVNGNAVNKTAVTGADGSYLIDGNLLPGTYSIAETQPAGYDLGGPNVYSNVLVQSSQHAQPFDFADLKSGSVAGRVFLDANNDGVDNGEAGIGGVAITLIGGGLGSPLTTTSAADGSYSFAGLLPGIYSVTETQPDGYLSSTGSTDVYTGIDLAPGQNAASFNFGEQSIPTAIPQSASTNEDTPVAITLGGSDIAGGILTYSIATAPQHGMLQLDGNLATYTPTDDYNGPDGFTFTVTNGAGVTSSPADVSITVTPVNDAPVANGDSATTAEDAAVTVNVLANDADVDGDALTVTGVGSPAHGSAVLNADGSITYTPAANYYGADSFTYGISDGNGGTASAVVSITVVEVPKSSLSGFTWIDFNDDGLIDFNEHVIAGVTVTLTGTNDLGQSVTKVTQSDTDGIYAFLGLRPGNYTVTESQPAGYIDGQDALGTVGGIERGQIGQDKFSQIQLNSGDDGINYNFGERPQAGAAVSSGQTATIGFWQNKNGQALLSRFDRSLGDWLAATLPNMYSRLYGKTGAEVAALYRSIFSSKVKTPGPTKVDCQVMAVAFAAFVTSSDLAGTVARNFGFTVTQYGVGIATFSVGTSGAAFGVANYSRLTVLDILLATNDRSINEIVYNNDALMRALANSVYTAINETGDIS